MTPQVTQASRYGRHLLIVLALLTPLTGTIRPAQAQAADMGSASMTAVTHVATMVIPAVVQLTVTAQPAVAPPAPADPAPFAPPSFRIPQLPRQFKRTPMGLGSGILMDAQGHILTAHHVVDGATTITALLAEKHTYPAQVIGVDRPTDLAVLKIDAPGPLPFATFGDSDALEVSTWVVAIGHPQGLVETGVNTAIASSTGGFEGIGFAIPSTMARAVARTLLASGKVERAWFGVEVHDVTQDEAQQLGLSTIQGVLVEAVVPGGPAAQGGLVPENVVLAYQAQQITITPGDLARVTQQALAAISARFGVDVRAVSAEETATYALAPHLGAPSPRSNLPVSWAKRVSKCMTCSWPSMATR